MWKYTVLCQDDDSEGEENLCLKPDDIARFQSSQLGLLRVITFMSYQLLPVSVNVAVVLGKFIYTVKSCES